MICVLSVLVAFKELGSEPEELVTVRRKRVNCKMWLRSSPIDVCIGKDWRSYLFYFMEAQTVK